MRALGGVDLEGQRLVNAAAPEDEDDLVTKGYTDSRLSELLDRFTVVDSVNHCTDPSFEYGTDGYTAIGPSGVIEWSTDYAHSGTHSLRVTSSVGQDAYNTQIIVPQGTYTYSAWLYIPVDSTLTDANIRLGGADWVGLTSPNVSTKGVWQRVSSTSVNNGSSNAVLYLNGVGDGIFYVDDVSFVEGDTPGDFNGDDSYDGTHFYRWTGEPGASTSERYFYAVEGSEGVFTDWAQIQQLENFPSSFKTLISDIQDASTFGQSLLNITDEVELKSLMGLNQVDNTSDSAKPVSAAMQAALDLKAAAPLVDNLTTRVGAVEAAQVDTTEILTRLTALEDKVNDFDKGGALQVGYLVTDLATPVDPEIVDEDTFIVRRAATPPSVEGYTLAYATDSNVDPMTFDPSAIESGSVIEPGDWMIATILKNSPNGIDTPAPAGWVDITPAINAAGTETIYTFAKQREEGETSYTFDLAPNYSYNAMLLWVREAGDPAGWVQGDVWTRDGTANDEHKVDSPSVDVLKSTLVLSFSYERTSAAESGVDLTSDPFEIVCLCPADATAIATIVVAQHEAQSSGTTPVNTVTYPNPQANNGLGYQIGITR